MTETKWDKGDRLRITIEAEATGKHDYPTIFIKGALEYPMGLNVSSIESAGGTVSVEVMPKPVALPTKKWAQVVIDDGGLGEILVTRTNPDEWRTLEHDLYFGDDYVAERHIRTLSEGVDE